MYMVRIIKFKKTLAKVVKKADKKDMSHRSISQLSTY